MTFYESKSDNELLKAMNGGDEQAFAVIYDKYWKILISLAYKHTKDRYLSEEIVQEVFLSLWRRKNELSIDSIGAYLATAIKFSIFKYLQQEKRHSKILNLSYKIHSNDLLEEKIAAKFLQEYIDGVVEQLPEKCRLVYLHSRKDGLKNSEIAQKLNVSEKAVEAHITKALRVLKLNLKEIGILLCIVIDHYI